MSVCPKKRCLSKAKLEIVARLKRCGPILPVYLHGVIMQALV